MRQNHSIPKAILWVVLVGVFGITACDSSSTPTTPTLEPAETYAYGASQIPTGMILFAELAYSDDCSEQCRCPVVEPPRRVYEWTSPNQLCIYEDFYNEYFPEPTSDISSISVLGLFGYGRYDEGLSLINALPYNEFHIPIYSVDSNGVIVIGLEGREYFLNPGQSWVNSYSSKSEPPAGCSIYHWERFTNYGLLEHQDINPCAY